MGIWRARLAGSRGISLRHTVTVKTTDERNALVQQTDVQARAIEFRRPEERPVRIQMRAAKVEAAKASRVEAGAVSPLHLSVSSPRHTTAHRQPDTMARSFGGSNGARGGAKAPFSSASYSSGPKSNGKGESEKTTGRNKKKKSVQDGSQLMNAVRRLEEKPAKKGKSSAELEPAVGKKDASAKKRRSAADAAIEEANMQGLNVYEYAPDHVKRSRTESSKFELSRDEAAFAGGSSRGGKRGLRGRNPMNDASDDDEDEDGDDMAKRIRKAARMIASEQLMNFDEDEELDGGSEEVDSDAAWNGSEGTDEERWGDAMRVLKKKSTQQTKKGKGKDKVSWLHFQVVPRNLTIHPGRFSHAPSTAYRRTTDRKTKTT